MLCHCRPPSSLRYTPWPSPPPVNIVWSSANAFDSAMARTMTKLEGMGIGCQWRPMSVLL